MSEFDEVVESLRKVFPAILNNPKIMSGSDISDEELGEIVESGKLDLEVLSYVAGDGFFEIYNNEVGLKVDEGQKVGSFLYKDAMNFLDELKKEFVYLK